MILVMTLIAVQIQESLIFTRALDGNAEYKSLFTIEIVAQFI